MRSQNDTLSGAMIQEKPLTFAKKLNVENFQASDGWLRCWKEKKKQLNFQDASRESKSVTPEMVDRWLETSLPTLL